MWCKYLECGCVVGELYGLASLGVDGLTQLIQYHRRRSGGHTNTKHHTHAAFHSIQNTPVSLQVLGGRNQTPRMRVYRFVGEGGKGGGGARGQGGGQNSKSFSMTSKRLFLISFKDLTNNLEIKTIEKRRTYFYKTKTLYAQMKFNYLTEVRLGTARHMYNTYCEACALCFLQQ